MKIVVVEPNKEAKAVEIDGSLDDYKRIVGGYIEVVRPFRDNACIVCNEEGKLIGLPENRPLVFRGRVHDIICGTFIVVGIERGEDGEKFCSLNENQIETYTDYFGLVRKCGGMEV